MPGGQPLLARQEERLFITVPVECATPYPEIVRKLKNGGAGDMAVDWTAVREAYLHGRGHSFPVGSADPSELLNEKLKIRLSEDRITAYMILYPAKKKGRRLTEHEVRELLIAYGIDDDLLELNEVRTALMRRDYGEPVAIARGSSPVDGEPYTISWDAPPTDPEGFLAYIGDGADIPPQVLKIVRPAQVAGKRIKPLPGRPGYTVHGQEIEPKPSLDTFVLGEGLRISPNGAMVLATVRGHLWLTGEGGHKAEVVPVLELEGNQDIGEITRTSFYPGSVIINGDVETNGLIRVMGDLEIRGALIGAGVQATGSLIVRDGIINTERHSITVGGLVTAAFYERARIEAHSIHIRRYSLHSKLYALNKIVGAKNCSLKGGEIEAGREITISVMGGANASPTRVAIGNRAATTLRETFKSWAGQFERTVYHDNIPDSLMVSQKEILSKLIEDSAQRTNFEDARITAVNVYPGVKIIIGNGVREPGEHLHRVRFTAERIGDKDRVALEKY